MTQLPEGFTRLRPTQEAAIQEIVEAFTEDDYDVVFLDAPTGAGKTLIGEMVRRELDARAMYVCSDKSLQKQFARDFPEAKVLMGRANYPTQSNPGATCADCTARNRDDSCLHCADGHEGCPYQIARDDALHADLAVTNTAYLLTEANYVGRFSGRELIIADEGDTLEDILMGFVEYRAPEHLVKKVGMASPKKGARKTTILDWLEEFAAECRVLSESMPRNTSDQYKEYRAVVGAADDATRVAKEIKRDIEARQADAEDNGVWLRDYDWRRKDGDDPGLILKPVTVNSHGTRNLWRHGQKWLIMSATIISPDEMVDSLGLPLDWTTVTVPMSFPAENRPIILAPIANPTYKEMSEAIPKLAHAIEQIAEYHEGERILVHTVSYKMASDLERTLKGKSGLRGRNIVTYQEGRQRDRALEQYMRRPDSIMLAPSMKRGIDLADDACRVQILAKCPFPALGDKQVSSRTHLPNGQMWYTVKTIRDIVQMTGRGVRHPEDYCTTYILDQQFARNLWSKWKRLFPAWWRDSVQTNQDVRWLMK